MITKPDLRSTVNFLKEIKMISWYSDNSFFKKNNPWVQGLSFDMVSALDEQFNRLTQVFNWILIPIFS